jgi:NADH-quinone oxidoreductase subunit C
MTPDGVAAAAAARFGAQSCSVVFGQLTVDVTAADWVPAMTWARDVADCTFFDWLSAVDEQAGGLAVLAHLYSPAGRHRVLLRTRVPADAPVLDSATGCFAGANWHEREAHEMFGLVLSGHPGLLPLLLPEGFEGHPLRKDFVLTARVAKAWPGAVNPGQSAGEAAAVTGRRRPKRPHGVPDPAEWGPR